MFNMNVVDQHSLPVDINRIYWTMDSLFPYAFRHVTELHYAHFTHRIMDRWQVNLDLKETLHHILTHGNLSDITFNFGPNDEPIKAHKLILAARSPVFERMCYGGMFDRDLNLPVDITDIDRSAFLELLRYMYEGICTMTAENVTSLFYGAHKYDIPPLMDRCRDFIIENTTSDDVCDTLRHAKLLGDEQLVSYCQTYIHVHAEDILKTQGFWTLNADDVSELIASDELEAEEIDIYRSCKMWAEARCKESDKEITTLNIREALGSIFSHIRFTLIELRTLDDMMIKGELILTDVELEDIRLCIKDKKDSPKFNMKHRDYRLSVIQRFDDVHDLNWVNSTDDAISFVTYGNASLVGVGLFSPCEPGEVTGHIEVFEGLKLLLHIPLTLDFEEDKFYEDIKFNHAVSIKKLRPYTIVQRFSGVKSYFSHNGKKVIYNNRVTVEFRRSSKSTNGTFENQGQIYRGFLKVKK